MLPENVVRHAFSFVCFSGGGGVGAGDYCFCVGRNERPQACGVAQARVSCPHCCPSFSSTCGPNGCQWNPLPSGKRLSRRTPVCPSQPLPLSRPPPARLEYMPLWKKVQGLSSAATTAAAAGPSVVDESEGGDGLSSRASSFASASGGDNGTLVVDSRGGGGGGGGGLTRGSSRIGSSGGRSGGGAAATEEKEEKGDVLGARARLGELEEELSFEDIIIFRAMAERQEALRRIGTDRDPRGGGDGRGGAGNRWGIGGWVRMQSVDWRIIHGRTRPFRARTTK